MKSYTLNSKSWHFYLASEWGQRIWIEDGPIDICTYIRRVIGGTIKLLLSTAIMAVLIGLLCAIEGSFFYCSYQYLFGNLADVSQHFLGLGAIGAVSNGFLALVAAYSWYKESNVKVPTPGFVSLATKKFKTKTCFMVDFD